MDHDSWNGDINYYRLQFHLKYVDYSKILPRKDEFEGIIVNSLNSFYTDENTIITGVDLVEKIDQYVDWAAIAPKHNKETGLHMINVEKDTLAKTGTGVIQIRDTKENEKYKQKHSYLLDILRQLGLQPTQSAYQHHTKF